MEERPIPAGVWVFWALVGLGLLFALLRWATGGNPTYIAPLASTVSAIAATISVYLATRTFSQNRKDRKEEIESRHPRFVVDEGAVTWVNQVGGDYAITPFHELNVVFKNVKENSAKHVSLKGEILDKDLQLLKTFNSSPTNYIETDGTFRAKATINAVWGSPDPYLVKMYLKYRDVRTGDQHNQTLWAKFYFQGDEEQTVLLEPVDKSELRAIQTR